MELDLKAVNALLVASAPALIVTCGAAWTAKTVTARIEKQKLEMQLAIEKQRMEFQSAIERERVEFQKEANLQSQEMELYKSLYSSRIDAVKNLMETVGNLHRGCMVWWFNWEPREELLPVLLSLNIDLYNSANKSEWVLTTQVFNAVKAFRDKAVGVFEEANPNYPGNPGEIEDMRIGLSRAVSEMMHHNDLVKLIGNKKL